MTVQTSDRPDGEAAPAPAPGYLAEARPHHIPEQRTAFPPGHFYSPIPLIARIKADEQRVFAVPKDGIPGVDLNVAGQRRLLEALSRFHDEMPFTDEKTEGLRYFFRNAFYSYGDATVLYAMLRHLRPARLIEIGSGHSSCLMLDINERCFDGRMQYTIVEPYPEQLASMISETEMQKVDIVCQRLQNMDSGIFEELGPNDVLFVDSTHVSKIDSDVNHLFFRILPCLRPGVVVHVHDINYPFEYLREWIWEGRCWNEAYLVRAFLQYNDTFEILYFNSYMYQMHREAVAAALPTCLRDPGGSLWLRKKA
ncbi:MAG: class I SAM-dependent methyltransferase [Planctomycetota bacterium]|jgi:predicted O-methyltransferase YrrM